MNAFEQLLNLPAAEKAARGIEFTPAEIAQQPQAWAQTAALLAARQPEIAAFLHETGLTGRNRDTVLLLTGAGTSEFIGNAIMYGLRALLQREVLSIPTTHLVTHAAETLIRNHSYVLLSFARSGNSPESMATYRLAQAASPKLRHLVVTCNRDGALAQAAAADSRTLCVLLPPETNDRSLVMTSSFSAMAFAGLALGRLDAPERLTELAVRLGRGAQRIMTQYGDLLHDFARRNFDRACFLGSNTLFGTMQECHLKMQEMTAGRVVSRFDSFLGLRHGPQVFVNDACIVVAALASDSHVRRYELDLLGELRAKEQSCGILVLCDRATPEISAITDQIIELWPEGDPAPDTWRVVTDVVAGQILGMFTSMKIGLHPDNPSTSGTINRVVQGVTIYARQGRRNRRLENTPGRDTRDRT